MWVGFVGGRENIIIVGLGMFPPCEVILVSQSSPKTG